MIQRIKKIFIGKPLPNWEYKHQRLSKKIALAVFSSDSLSSVAYATEEILIVLMTAGAAALSYALPIALVILFLLWILILSYRETIKAYPNGGGAYIVAKENISTIAGLVAASALLLDYILTVAVSVAAGVAAVTSVYPGFLEHKVIIGIVVVFLIGLLNLKGIKESGVIFAIPTYLFLFSFMIMIGVGFFRYFTGQIVPTPAETIPILNGLSLFLLLRAFSSGCAALTGIEAVSDGVPAFKTPESKNARTTLLIMAGLLTFLFFGITFLALHYQLTPVHDRTVISVLAENIFGRTPFFFIIQAFTMLILFLAANTSFADFPRLCFFLAKDKFLPKQFMQLGDRLVFTNGILFLSIASSILLILFHGNVHHLIPLYAVGVFTSFTLSQTGMIRRSLKLKQKGWKHALVINTIGAIMTFIALVIITSTKFMSGAWIIVILIVILVLIFKKINIHYCSIAKQLSTSNIKAPIDLRGNRHKIVVLVQSFHQGIVKSLRFAKTFSSDVVAVHIDISGAERDRLIANWERFNPKMDLVIISSPYRVIIPRLMSYLDKLESEDPKLNVTIIIPEFVPKKWWHHILHNQTAFAIKAAIHFRPRTSYISVQYHLEE
ncbi:MAG: APC family permease [Nanoarchaeota archaeon]|nr:APC family permease [Nanoarchaeota archaeon]